MKFSFLKFIFMFNCMFRVEEGGDAGFMGGAGGGGAAPAPEEGGAGGEGPTYAYPEGLDPSYHGNPTLLKFANDDGSFNQANIMKSLIHAQSQIGGDKIPVPNKEFTDEQWRETFHKLGLPNSMEEYGIENKLNDGQTGDEKMFEGFKQIAYEAGILPNQAQKIVDFFNENMQTQSQGMQEQMQAKLDTEISTLKKEWGEEGFEKNVSIADQALRHLVPDENELKEIIDLGVLNSAVMTKLFHKIGQGLQEDEFDHTVKGSYGMDNNQLDDKIASLNGELRTIGKNHPQYNSKLKEYQDTLNKRYGNKPVAGSAQIR